MTHQRSFSALLTGGLFVLALCTAGPGADLAIAQARVPLAVPPAAIDTLFAEWDHPDTPGAALSILRGGEVIYTRGYGSANLEYGVPITPQSVFLVASVSKQFTAFAIAMLAAEGRLSLDDEVRAHVPELHAFDKPITIRHLLHHTSGLRDEFDLLGMAGWRMDDVITKEDILRLAYAQRALNFAPGTEYSYSNTGYTLLAEIVERVTGQSFRHWMAEHVFEPLGMTRSHIHDAYEEVDAGRVQGYSADGQGGFKKQIYSYQSVGASGLFTTVEDLGRWVNHFRDPVVGGPQVIAQMYERGRLANGDTLSYALGLGIADYKGHRRISHSGWHRGFRTYVAHFPDDDLAIILLGNQEQFDAAAKALQVMDLFLAPPPEALRAYAGAYHSDELDTTYTFTVEDGRLVGRHRRNAPFTLRFDGPDRFTTDAWFFDQIVFTREDGRVTGFEGSTKRARNLRFTRPATSPAAAGGR